MGKNHDLDVGVNASRLHMTFPCITSWFLSRSDLDPWALEAADAFAQ